MNKFKIAAISFFISSIANAYEFYHESPISFAKGGVLHGGNDFVFNTFNKPDELHLNNKFRMMINFNGQISKQTYELIQNVPEPKEGKYEKELDHFFGNKYHINSNLNSAIFYKNFMVIPYYFKARSNAQVNYKVYPEGFGYIQQDQGSLLGYSHLFNDLSIGFNSIFFKRNHTIYDIDLISALNKEFEFKDSEYINTMNFSLGYHFKNKKHKNQIYFIYNNFNHPNSKSKYSQINEDLLPIGSLGFRHQFNSLNFDFNYLDIFSYLESIRANKFRAGLSYDLNKFLIQSASIGVIDGGLSLGTSIGYNQIKLNLATYEKNIYNFYQKNVRFYSLGFNLGF